MLPTGPDPGTCLSLGLCPPATLPMAPQPCSLCPPGCFLSNTSVCPRWVLRRWGVALARVGTMGRPQHQDPWQRRAEETFPGVHLPLLWVLSQYSPCHRMVHGWQRGAGREAVSGCRRWAGGGCKGCRRQRGIGSRRQRGRGKETGSRRQAGMAARNPPPLPAASPLCQ